MRLPNNRTKQTSERTKRMNECLEQEMLVFMCKCLKWATTTKQYRVSFARSK